MIELMLGILMALIGIVTAVNIYFFTRIDGHIDSLNSRMDSLNSRMDGHASRIDQLYQMFVDLLKERSPKG